MTLHKGTKVQAGGVGVGLNLEFSDDHDESHDQNGRGAEQFIPHGFFTHQINDSTWFGLGITVPFGMGTEYGESWAHNATGVSANIMTVDINPNVAWKVNEKFSIGAGISLQYAQADLKKKSQKSLGDATLTPMTEIDADSTAWGWNVGVMWSPLENLRFGLSYRSNVVHDAEGDLTIEGLPDAPDASPLDPAMLNGTYKGSATVEAPAWAMATAAWDVNDLLSLYATFRWANWSSFDTLEVEGSATLPTGTAIPLGTTIKNNWKDTYLFSVGGDLRLTDFWTLRGGVGYETSPIKDPKTRTSIIPDANRWWFAVGSSFKWSEQFSTDVSFAHLHGVGERNLWEDGKKVGRFRRLDAYLLGVQMQYQF